MKTAKFLARFWDDQSGAAAEYVVLLALIGTALVASVLLLEHFPITRVHSLLR